MKATINGITVEGTPEEVWAFMQKSNAQGTNLKPVKPMPNTINYDWIKGLTQVMSDATSRCPNSGKACFCTGECHGKTNNAHAMYPSIL